MHEMEAQFIVAMITLLTCDFAMRYIVNYVLYRDSILENTKYLKLIHLVICFELF